MGISTVTDTDGRNYYRICRTWNNLHHQTYVPFGSEPDKAFAAAKKLDRILAREQQSFLAKWRNSYLSLQKANGHIKHLGYRVVKRKGRKPAPELRVRIPESDTGGLTQKSYSITEYGFDTAFAKAVDFFLEYYQYKEKEAARAFLLEAKQFYLSDYNYSIAEIVPLFVTQPENNHQQHDTAPLLAQA